MTQLQRPIDSAPLPVDPVDELAARKGWLADQKAIIAEIEDGIAKATQRVAELEKA